jgi:hypothetical protein
MQLAGAITFCTAITAVQLATIAAHQYAWWRADDASTVRMDDERVNQAFAVAGFIETLIAVFAGATQLGRATAAGIGGAYAVVAITVPVLYVLTIVFTGWNYFKRKATERVRIAQALAALEESN